MSQRLQSYSKGALLLSSSVLTNECHSAVPGLNVVGLAVLVCSWRDTTGMDAGEKCFRSIALLVQAQSWRETLSGCTIPDLSNGSLCMATMEDAYHVLEILHTLEVKINSYY